MVNSIASNCLSVRLRLMNRKVGAIFDNALRPHGIRASQLNILVAVSAFGRVTSRQLCRVLHMDASTFSRALALAAAALMMLAVALSFPFLTITASGITVFGLGAAVWGLIAGGIVHVIARRVR